MASSADALVPFAHGERGKGWSRFRHVRIHARVEVSWCSYPLSLLFPSRSLSCPLTYDRQVSRSDPGRIGNAVRPEGQIGSGCAAVTGDALIIDSGFMLPA